MEIFNDATVLPPEPWSSPVFIDVVRGALPNKTTAFRDFSVRDLRYYQQMGLFPESSQSTRGNAYTITHLMRLLATQMLRTKGLKQKAAIEKAVKMQEGELTALFLTAPVCDFPESFASDEPETDKVYIRKESLAAWFLSDSDCYYVTRNGVCNKCKHWIDVDSNIAVCSNVTPFPGSDVIYFEGEFVCFPRAIISMHRHKEGWTINWDGSLVQILPEIGNRIWEAFRMGSVTPLKQVDVRLRLIRDSILLSPRAGQSFDWTGNYRTDAFTYDDFCVRLWKRSKNRFAIDIGDSWASEFVSIHIEESPWDVIPKILDAASKHEKFEIKETNQLRIWRTPWTPHASPGRMEVPEECLKQVLPDGWSCILSNEENTRIVHFIKYFNMPSAPFRLEQPILDIEKHRVGPSTYLFEGVELKFNSAAWRYLTGRTDGIVSEL